MFGNNPTTSGVLIVVIASVIWGTTGTAASLIPDVSALAIGAFAMGGGGLLLFFNARHTLRQDKTRLLARPGLLLCGGLSVAIYPLAFYSSMRFSGVAIGTVISIASAPLFTVLLERLISKKYVSLKWFISFLFGTAGIVLMTMGRQDSVIQNQGHLLRYCGVGLGLIAGLGYSAYSWCARQMIENGVHSKSSMAGMFGLAACLLLPSLFLTGDHLFADGKHIAVAMYMAVVPMFVGYLLFGYGLRYIEASQATLITLLEPVVAALFAVFFVGEKFSTTGWYGMGLIAVCLLFQVVKWPVVKAWVPDS
ncbi:DMT family transporter [Vibrio quintilis]|uniref:Putative DMT superfamily transporter inner membrane protein n=1 Tax=Vibrio quintilis TaxID=1117707 RepID=A0A1M7YR51_9VIBR|nr:EamA family transporter [Vibrio quintilis]SHO55109.1 putative DMT superfamily transporter inner membrane protein [Vibrio quintilis]